MKQPLQLNSAFLIFGLSKSVSETLAKFLVWAKGGDAHFLRAVFTFRNQIRKKISLVCKVHFKHLLKQIFIK